MGNLLIAIAVSFCAAFGLIYLISRHDRSLRSRQENPSGEGPGDFRLFAKFCTDLCESLKLEVKDVARPHDDEIVIHAEGVNPVTRLEFLVVGIFLPAGAEVDGNRIMGISDQVVSERLSKAIVVTPGRFAEAVRGLPELAPMEFIDGDKMEDLRKKMIL